MRILSLFLLAAVLMHSCKSEEKKTEAVVQKIAVETIVSNAKIYSVNANFSIYEAMAITNGEVVALGTSKEISELYTTKNTINANGLPIYPGFADPHCHFLGYARTLFNVDLVGTKSQEEVLKRLVDFFGDETSAWKPSGWIHGRGWDQNDWAQSGWNVNSFPAKDALDKLYPNNPVALRRVDGHALWVNSKALEMAGITAETRVVGGEVVLDSRGKPTGILIDNAMDLVLNLIPENIKERDEEAVQKAQENCFAVGLTFMHDAGLPLQDVLFLKEQYANEKLAIRLYQMISNEEAAVDYFAENGPIETDNFWVKSIKCYMDGALGSRGAWLKQPYHDAKGSTGLQLTDNDAMKSLLQKALEMGFQVNTHAIGDSAVANTLNLYASFLQQDNDLRWRIEHSQVVDKTDLEIYKQYNIIPSIQATHATSDMYWADERLGERIEDAYAYKDLLNTNGWILNGSDFPVEGINPLYGFYAAVARMDQEGYPDGGFQKENALSREDALKAMTIWAAKGAFLENELGSLEPGKKADFVMLERDIMEIPEKEIFSTKVSQTYINGKLAHSISKK